MDFPGYKVEFNLAGHCKAVSSVKFSPDGNFLATSSVDTTVRVWDVATGRCRHVLRGHSRGVSDLSWSPDSRTICSSSDDRTVRIFDVHNSATINVLSGHTDQVFTVDYNPKSNMIASHMIASGSFDNSVRLFDVRSNKALLVLPGHGGTVSAVHFSPDSSVVASSSYDGIVRLWDSSTGNLLKSVAGKDETPLGHVKFSPNGHFVLVETLNESVQLWNYKESKVAKTYIGHRNNRYSIHSTFVTTLHGVVYVVSGSEDGSVYIWDLKSMKCVQRLNHGDSQTDIVRSVSSHPTKNLLASGALREDQNLKLWNAPPK